VGLREEAAAAGRVLREAAPLMVAELLPSAAWLTDIGFVSPLGPSAAAAVGAGGYANWLLGVSLNAFYTGLMVVAGQAWGSGRRRLAERAAGETLAAALLAAVLLAAAGYLAAPFFASLLVGEPGVAELAARYIRARVVGLPGLAALLVYDAALRGTGAGREILVGNAAAAAVNIILDPLLIYAAGLGVPGAGYATAASNYVGGLVLAVYVDRRLGGALPRRPGGLAVRVARVGFPAMAERLAFAAGHGVYLASVARCGPEALAAHSVGVRVESLAFLPAWALSTYASSVVAQAVGSGDVEAAEERGWEAVKAGTVFMAAMGVVLAAASPLAALLAPAGAARRLTVLYLILAAASEPALGAAMVAAGAVRGAGDTRTPTVVNLAALYLLRVAPSAALAGRLGGALCPVAAWLLMDLDTFARAVLLAWLYRRRFRSMARRVV